MIEAGVEEQLQLFLENISKITNCFNKAETCLAR